MAETSNRTCQACPKPFSTARLTALSLLIFPILDKKHNTRPMILSLTVAYQSTVATSLKLLKLRCCAVQTRLLGSVKRINQGKLWLHANSPSRVDNSVTSRQGQAEPRVPRLTIPIYLQNRCWNNLFLGAFLHICVNNLYRDTSSGNSVVHTGHQTQVPSLCGP